MEAMILMSMDTLFNVEDEVESALSELGILTKIDEMDDFMNQNDLKVSITNENAVTTGLVTYTCTVKDNNNTALANRVVEWYKGTTLIGYDATDSNGVSTISQRVTEADIYDVHAIVRGTHAGDDIRMFVKDKENLFSHNIWSGTDYKGDTTDFTRGGGVTLTSSTEYYVNGDKSLKLTRIGDSQTYVRFSYDNPVLLETIKLSGSIKTVATTAIVFIVERKNGETINQQTITVPTDTTEVFELTYTTSSDNNQILIQVGVNTADGVLFLDNLNLKIQ